MSEMLLLRTFLAVAAELSFRKAAKALHAAPSTVTSRIKALEEELGVRLFARQSRSVVLTEEGRRLVGHAARLTELAGRTRQVASGREQAPEVRLRVSETLGVLCLPAVLREIRRRFPTVRLQATSFSREGTVHDLRRGAVDAALLLGEPFSGPGLSVEILRREPLAVYTAPDGPLADRESVGPGDLEGAPLVLTRHVWSARAALGRGLAGEGAASPGDVECTSAEIVKRCVLAGLGVSAAPWPFVAGEAQQGLLRVLPWSGEPLEAAVLLVRDRTRTPSAAAQALLQAVREYYAAPCAQKGTAP
jgi:DNA-binding transcriptional LysR family regulator